jgi:hypothetical protein
MRTAVLATIPLILALPLTVAAQQRARPAAQAAPSTITVTATDLSGAPLAEVRVNLTGSLDRSGSTQQDGTVKFDGMRPGVYRLRFTRDDLTTLEKEIEIRAGQPAPAPSVALTPAPPAPKPPPPAPEPAKPAPVPPGKPMTVSVLDLIERELITNSQPQKVSTVGCNGVANTLLWQIREPWTDRQHDSAEAQIYVVAGEGTLRLDNRDTPLAAGSFASVPRGMSYSLTRRGRNPLIVLATLAGEPCQ